MWAGMVEVTEAPNGTVANDVGIGAELKPTPVQGPDGRFKSVRPPSRDERKAEARALFDKLNTKPTADEVQAEIAAKPAENGAAPVAPDEAPTPEPAAPKVDAEKLRVGKEALARLHVPKSVLSKMDESEIAEFGEQAKEFVDEKTQLFREVKELRQAKEAAAKSAEPAKAERPALDFDALARPFAEASFDENSGKALKSALQGVHDPLNERIGNLEKFIQQLVGTVKGNVHEGARAELVKRFPQLSDPDVSARVKDGAEWLAERYPERFASDPLKAWTRAAEIEELQQAEPVVPSSPPTPRKGLPVTTANRPPGPKVLSEKDKARIRFEAIQNGVTDQDKLNALTDGK